MAQHGKLNRSVAWVIARRREEANLTQKQVWIRLGMSKSSYLRLEWSERAWTVDELDAVCEMLGVDSVEVYAEAKSIAVQGGPPDDGLGKALGF